MTRRDILEKHWKNYLISVGLPYQPMSERAYEELEKAMEEYAAMRTPSVIKSVCGDCIFYLTCKHESRDKQICVHFDDQP